MRKIVFYLMNKKGYSVLDSFLRRFGRDKVQYVVLSEDRFVQNDYYEELQGLCSGYSVQCFRRGDSIPHFGGYKIAVGWRWIIDNPGKLVVLHDSLLPRYRGFAPLVNMLINGEMEIGVTALLASDQYDKGSIIGQEKVAICYPLRIADAIDIVSNLYSRLVNYVAESIFRGEPLVGVPQDEESATYSLWRDDLDYLVNWNRSSKEIRRMVDAVGYPYSGARASLNGKEIIIDEVEEYPDVVIENRDAGKVIFLIDGNPVVVCGEGLLRIIRARYVEGGSVIPLKKFRSRFGGRI